MSKEVHGDSTQEVQNGKLQDSYYSFGYWRKVPERRWITKSRWLHVQKSHWKSTISNCHKTRYMFATSLLSRFMQSPSQVHYAAAKRILRYLRGTKDFGIWYKSTNDAKLVGYTDSDWAGSVDDMKSTSGYTFSLGSGIFSWASKKQATVAQSQRKQNTLQLLQHQIKPFGLEGS
ncbi:UNVERIFIED_CONTAM: Secreted RxLR effector protein [Sesamum radiatum]|uniref:Secreted RxLR effector protein n=1 Tax=Sesamum radiatum TaxID=300843 RepID=A0AAW2JXD8_SESRA